MDGAHRHDGPTRLAVGDDAGLALGVRVHRMPPLDEGSFGGRYIAQRLTGNRLGQEADEIAGMARLQGITDLAVRLEATDAGTVARPRIDNDEGAFCRIDPHPGPRMRQ